MYYTISKKYIILSLQKQKQKQKKQKNKKNKNKKTKNIKNNTRLSTMLRTTVLAKIYS